MTEQSGKGDRAAPPRGKGSRQDRLKSALRENLKRRKGQAKARSGMADAPSHDEHACPHGEVGKRDD